MAALAPVFIGILHQIKHCPGEERGVVRGLDAGLDIGLERHAALVRGDEFIAAGVYKAGEIAHAQRVLLRALLDTREREQLLNERIHLVALLLDDVDGGEKILLRFRLALCAVALGEDHRHRRAQLVRRVGSELLFGEERCFEPGEHAVKRVGEPPHLPRAAPEIEPGGEIVAVGYAAGSLGDALEREERIPRDEPAAADREQQQNRQQRPGKRQYDAPRPRRGVRRDHAAHPEPRDRHIDIGIVYEPVLPVRGVGAHRARLERQSDCFRKRHGAAEIRPPGVIVGAVHPVLVFLHIVPFKNAVVKFHGIGAVRYGFYQPGSGIGDHRAVHDQHERERDRREQEHHQREPENHPPFCRHIQSSRSTQPVPHTVWMSFLENPASIFLRR